MKKEAFNKENPIELLSQLMKVLRRDGLEDSVDLMERHKLLKVITEEYLEVKRRVAFNKQSKANLTPKRQRTQYSCMSTSMSMCLQALDYPHATEDEVNKVMGALPMQGAAWEQALACAQHYGCRATLTMPSTVKQLKEWTDRGIPVMIAWNPEGRDWSHASVVFDVDDDLNVYVADPNIPDPDETVRIVPKAEFYSKWYEKWPNYLVRRPACAIEREITPDGRQVMASKQKGNKMSNKQELYKIAKEIKSIKAQLRFHK